MKKQTLAEPELAYAKGMSRRPIDTVKLPIVCPITLFLCQAR